MKAFRSCAMLCGILLLGACAPEDLDPFAGDGSVREDGGDGAWGDDGRAGDDAPAEDGEAVEPTECRDVDILFVVDNSGSMADNQQSLINSFPGFVAAIRERLAFATSYHVGVVTTDAYSYNEAGCRQIGDLVTQTGGIDSSDAVCAPFSSGARFLDAGEPDLADKFACAAKVGVLGSDDERVARALLDAVKPERNAPGGCNAGFARPNSLLVIVLITDEDDVPEVCTDPTNPTPFTCETFGSGGDPDTWYEEILGYRGGVPENVVVLSLIGTRGDNPCGAVPASKLMGFAHRFGVNGYVGDVCADNYDAFFTETLPIIDRACEDFVFF